MGICVLCVWRGYTCTQRLDVCADRSTGGRSGAFATSHAFREFECRFETAFGDTLEECCEERVGRERCVCVLLVFIFFIFRNNMKSESACV